MSLSTASLNNHLHNQSTVLNNLLTEVHRGHESQELQHQNDQHRQCHQGFKTSTYERFKDFNPERIQGTGQWVLSHPQYHQWHVGPHNDLLWVSADPGCGKSTYGRHPIPFPEQNPQSSNDPTPG